MKAQISMIINGKRTIIKKPELLAPAGDLEKLEIAYHYGADAVFIGGKEYSLRSRASNFDLSSIKEACLIAKKYRKKLYVTVNMYMHNENLTGFKDYLKELEKAGVDAIICADPYAIQVAIETIPNVEVHVSTQQSVVNSQTVNFWKECGCTRVVLAREVSKDELALLMQNTECEIEYFIHGAMCIAYSGRCMLSNEFSRRDSNRGGCSQSCRWDYEIESKSDVAFSMSSKDMALFEGIPELIELGVDSLKIEGRMKSIHYIATVVKTYRELIDMYCSNPNQYMDVDITEKELLKSANRPISTGFFFGQPTKEQQLFNQREQHPTKEFIGLVLAYDNESKLAKVEQRNNFKIGQSVEVFGPNITNYEFKIQQIYDENMNEIDVAPHPLQVVYIKIDQCVNKFDMIRRVK